MNSTATLAWFARHELRIAWRDLLGMMTSGRRSRQIGVVLGLAVVAAVMHLLAYAVIGRAEDPFASPAPATLTVISASTSTNGNTIARASAIMVSATAPILSDITVVSGYGEDMMRSRSPRA